MDSLEFSVQIAAQGRRIVSIDHLVIEPGHITFLFGESGIGKSLIMKALFGALDPEQLEIEVNGMSYREYLGSDIAARIRSGFLVFQEPSTHLNPLMRMRDQLREGVLALETEEKEILTRLWGKRGFGGAEVLLPLYPKPYRPSGGEKQRILLAMAFKKIALYRSGEPALFAFDEPTGSLDDDLRNLFLAYLFECHRKKRFTALLVTHDYSMVTCALRADPVTRAAISFRELVSKRHTIEMRDYEPEGYQQWITNQRGRRSESRAGLPLLSVASGLQVFGRRMAFSIDQEGRHEHPLEVYRGCLTYLKAPSGTGKTTVAKAVMGLVRARGLRMTMAGRTFTDRDQGWRWRRRVMGRVMTMVFQHADEALNLASRASGVLDGLPRTKYTANRDLHRVLELLFDAQEISEVLMQKIRTLSGGQKQRLNLLRSLVLDCGIMILDEPLNGLDLEGVKRVLRLLDILKSDGKGILIISHNEEIFDTQADRVFYLNGWH